MDELNALFANTSWLSWLSWLSRIVAIVSTGALIVFVKKYSDFFDWFRMRRLDRILSFEARATSNELKDLLSRTREEELFSLATGIKAEGALMQYLDLIKSTDGRVTIHSLRSAQRYLKVGRNGKLGVRTIKWADKILSAFSFFSYAAILVIFLTLAFGIFDSAYKSYFAKPASVDGVGLSIAAFFSLTAAIVGIFFALWAAQPNVALAAAKRLNSDIKNDGPEN